MALITPLQPLETLLELQKLILLHTLILLNFVPYQNDAGRQKEINKLDEYNIGFFTNMSLGEFKEMTIKASFFGLFFLAAINFVLGLLGGPPNWKQNQVNF